MILRKWCPETPLEKLNLTSVPIWIRLPGLPLQFWSANGISKIASYIGNPLYMDSKTADTTRLSYARCCIEVEPGNPYPEYASQRAETTQVWRQVTRAAKGTPKVAESITNGKDPEEETLVPSSSDPAVADSAGKNPVAESLGLSSCDPANSVEISSGNNLSPGIQVQNSYMALVDLNDSESVQEVQDLNGHDRTQTHACNITPSGRIWILWDPKVISFQALYLNPHIIHGECQCLLSGQSISLSAIYAANDASERRQLWSSLVGLASAAQVPWIALGDFNITRFADERCGGAAPNTSDMNDFNSCIEDCSLLDLRSVGQTLSWNNSSRTGHLKLRRLDRALVNEE
ncbi:uncharacterized protein LOC143862934 [Tasmannia lanceolata]|uniref:uncharacterized protein LOC143862934 n=1 Tax=Tasmannia lanceolata TaxID=3420 RepID=UPI00406373C6